MDVKKDDIVRIINHSTIQKPYQKMVIRVTKAGSNIVFFTDDITGRELNTSMSKIEEVDTLTKLKLKKREKEGFHTLPHKENQL